MENSPISTSLFHISSIVSLVFHCYSQIMRKHSLHTICVLHLFHRFISVSLLFTVCKHTNTPFVFCTSFVALLMFHCCSQIVCNGVYSQLWKKKRVFKICNLNSFRRGCISDCIWFQKA